MFSYNRVSGTPVLFDWTGMKLEGFIFEKDESKRMALGISIKGVRLDEIVEKLFKKKILQSSWLSNLDAGMGRWFLSKRCVLLLLTLILMIFFYFFSFVDVTHISQLMNLKNVIAWHVCDDIVESLSAANTTL